MGTMKKNVVAGLGEIGTPLYKLLSNNGMVVGYDINPKLINSKKLQKFQNIETLCLHVCIPFTKKFIQNVQRLVKKFSPEILVIHLSLIHI